ncbi:MAG: carboxypeptidase regulatory-like domain-containing protein [Candidatus Methanomethylicia archaeon]
MIKRRIVSGVLVLIFVTLCIYPANANVSSQFFFTGKVTTSSGDPIAGAKIEIKEDYDYPITYTSYTGQDGMYIIPLVRTVCSNYFVTASHPGYYTQTKHVSVNHTVGFVYVNFTLIKKTRSAKMLQGVISFIQTYPMFKNLKSIFID